MKPILIAVLMATCALPAWAQATDPAPPLPDQGASADQPDKGEALAPLPTVTLDQPPVGRAMEEVSAYLNALTSLQADFIQTNPDGGIARGQLAMKRPGRVRFEYSDDTPVLIIADGDTLTYVDYEVDQVTRWPIEETPLAMLLAEDIDLSGETVVATSGPGAQPDLIEIIARDAENPQQGTVMMSFQRQEDRSLKLAGWRVVDAQGYLTKVELADVQTGISLDSDLWQFDDPRTRSLRKRLRRP